MVAESPYRDAACCGVSIVGAVALVKSFDLLATGKVIDQARYCINLHACMIATDMPQTQQHLCGHAQKLSRKLVHITSGPLFLLTWPLFRYEAPLLVCCSC